MAEAPVQKILRDEHLLNIAQKVTDYGILRKLACRGLKLEDHEIQSSITEKQNDVQMAAHDLLRIWLKTQNSKEEAFTNLHAALQECQLEMLADELVKEPEEKSNEQHSNESLKDVHIYQLSTKITNMGDLRTLAYRGLKLKHEDIESAINNHPNDIQSAAHKVLRTWCLQQPKQEALGSLHEALRECEMKGLSAELTKWVEGSIDSMHLSPDRMYQIYFLLIWKRPRVPGKFSWFYNLSQVREQ